MGGSYHFRVNDEYHLLNPLTISKLQHSVREKNFKTFQEYAELIDQQNQNLATLRRLALNILRTHPDRASIRRKIKRAGWDDAFLLSMLSHMR